MEKTLKLKKIIIIVILLCSTSLLNNLYTQNKSDFIISTRLGLNSIKERNLYFSYFISDTIGLQFSVAYLENFDWNSSIGCSELSIRKYFEKRGFAVKGGITIREKIGTSILLHYRNEKFEDFLFRFECDFSGPRMNDRRYNHWKSHEIGLMNYFDTNKSYKWINFYFAFGLGVRFVDEEFYEFGFPENIIQNNSAEFVVRLDLGLRLNLRI
jgi:hypothetical protein